MPKNIEKATQDLKITEKRKKIGSKQTKAKYLDNFQNRQISSNLAYKNAIWQRNCLLTAHNHSAPA
jgi:hypothetical protein